MTWFKWLQQRFEPITPQNKGSKNFIFSAIPEESLEEQTDSKEIPNHQDNHQEERLDFNSLKVFLRVLHKTLQTEV